ncbi:hypothetical protein ABH926_008628 [Catenulispora sp. GP43]|uniref:hypothetical protein n=1 Tax=Catenulispora sp. GP43 TaxID=3156263 RepID=UPI00351563A9
MMEEKPRPLFPQRRDDGTFSVAIRYRVPAGDPAIADAIRSALGLWLRKKLDVHHVDMDAEFADLPHTEVEESGDVLVVFDGLPNSFLWKGLMVEVAREMEPIDGATYAGFWDLVAGRPHPASVRRDS